MAHSDLDTAVMNVHIPGKPCPAFPHHYSVSVCLTPLNVTAQSECILSTLLTLYPLQGQAPRVVMQLFYLAFFTEWKRIYQRTQETVIVGFEWLGLMLTGG